MNIYHEFGHVIDNSPSGSMDRFTHAFVARESFLIANQAATLSEDGLKLRINPDALRNEDYLDDPNWPQGARAIQAYNLADYEVWADIFSNYVAGNIKGTMAGDRDLPVSERSEGQVMYDFVSWAIARYAQ